MNRNNILKYSIVVFFTLKFLSFGSNFLRIVDEDNKIRNDIYSVSISYFENKSYKIFHKEKYLYLQEVNKINLDNIRRNQKKYNTNNILIQIGSFKGHQFSPKPFSNFLNNVKNNNLNIRKSYPLIINFESLFELDDFKFLELSLNYKENEKEVKTKKKILFNENKKREYINVPYSTHVLIELRMEVKNGYKKRSFKVFINKWDYQSIIFLDKLSFFDKVKNLFRSSK